MFYSVWFLVAVPGSSQKAASMQQLQYGQVMNNNVSLGPSQLFVSYDPGQPISNQPQPPQQPAANLASSQIIGSQLVTQRGLQNIQTAVPAGSSFYSQPQPPLQQTGFYQAQQAASTITVSTSA